MPEMITNCIAFSFYQIRTSGSSRTPDASHTRDCTIAIVFFTSSADAPPVFTTKPACFFDTSAPPKPHPLSPARSMSGPANYPSGRLNVLPADGSSSGCEAFLFSISVRIVCPITSGSPVCKRRTALTITQGSF